MASDASSQDLAARGLRPLLSAPDSQRMPVQLSNLRPKNKSVRAACESCRKKKSKCTGERPQCQPCAARGSACHYETVATETHSQARKRKFEDMNSRTAVLQEFFSLLRHLPVDLSRELLDRHRAGDDPETVLEFYRNEGTPTPTPFFQEVPATSAGYEFPYLRSMPRYLLSSDNVYLRSQLYDVTMAKGDQSPFFTTSSGGSPVPGGEETVYLKPYHLARIEDERFDHVNASKWTSVIADNQLLAALLNAYFMHAYPAFPAFQKDLFLDDMVTGQTHFCSQLLVNSVLAHACHCYKPLTNRSNHFTSQSLAYRFVVEAKRLWDIEDIASPKLTTIQAAMVLNVIYNSNATDRIGSTLLVRAVSMADELEIMTHPNRGKSPKIVHARQFTAWCLFVWQIMHGYYFLKPPLIEKPPAFALPDPDRSRDWYGEIWLKYPLSGSLARLNFPHVFKSWAELRVVLNHVSMELYKKTPPQVHSPPRLSRAQFYGFSSALEDWHRTLPPCLTPELVALPCQLRLHIEYHAALHGLYQSQKDEESPPPIAAPTTHSSSGLSIQDLCLPNPASESGLATAMRPPLSAQGLGGGSQAHRSFSNEAGLPARAGPLPSSGALGMRRTPLPSGPSGIAEYGAPPQPPLTLRLPLPQISSSGTPPAVSASSPFSHVSPSYHRQNLGSPGYTFPNRLPPTPGSGGSPGSIAVYSISPAAPISTGFFSNVPATGITGYTAPPTIFTTQRPSPTPRPSLVTNRTPSTAATTPEPWLSSGRTKEEASTYAMNCVEILARLYYLRHGFEHYDSFLIHFLTMLGTSTTERMERITNRNVTLSEAFRSTVALCLKGVYCQSKNFYLAAVVAKMLRSLVRSDDLQLILNRGDLSEVEEDTTDIQADNIRAEWPIPITTFSDDRTKSMIDTLVHTVEGFKISSDED